MSASETCAGQFSPEALVHFVGIREFCELIISRRKLERLRGRAGCLRDLVSDELFVLTTGARGSEERPQTFALPE